ncbi:MAG: LysM peptidoglycan-binding domain-containing protein [Anaerolineales bacterium]|jgi:LysM repeat protein
MITHFSYNQIVRAVTKAAGALLVLAVLVTALPQPSLAATDESCRSTYTVKSGDYLSRIADDFDVSLSDLANANDLKSPYMIYIGQQLCIPGKSSSGSSGSTGSTGAGSKASISVSKSKDTITITTSNFPTKNSYYVKVDNARDNKLEWSKVGVLNTGKESSVKASFKLPDALKNASSLNVCLKNIYTDVMVCNNPDLNRGSTKSDSSSSSTTASWKGTFSVKIVGRTVEITTSKLPTNSFFNVKADNASNRAAQWYRIGMLRIGKNGTTSASYKLPEALEKATKVNVCLKNAVNDTVACHTAYR